MILLRINKIWHLLLTEERYHKVETMFFCPSNFEQIIQKMYSRVRGSRLKDISTRSRHLDDENIKKLNSIQSKGPHSLCSMCVFKAMLTNHFSKNWYFTMMKASYFASQTVYCRFKLAKSLPNSLIGTRILSLQWFGYYCFCITLSPSTCVFL